MADINYSDIQRAAADATRDIFSQVQKIQQNVQQMGNVQQCVLQVAAMQQQIVNIARQMQVIDSRIDKIARQNFANNVADQRITIMCSDINELKVRFGAFERFAQDMSKYINSEFERHQLEADESSTTDPSKK